jgi:biotin transport system substrate-specific component
MTRETIGSMRHAAFGRSERLHRIALGPAGVIGFAVLTALAAKIAIPLPGTPVPMTMQSLVVLLAAVFLGPRLGLASMAVYVGLGTAGYDVFALSRYGFGTLQAVTGGYLLGFVLAQPVVGAIARPGRGVAWRLLAGLLAGKALIFACGCTWLAFALQTDVSTALALGLVPFLPGMMVKLALAYPVGLAVLQLRACQSMRQ